MRVSVIIPVWNGRYYLPGCLDTLLAQADQSTEIIVVDNASKDGSADLVIAEYPKVHLIRNSQNLGFAGACNIGIRAAIGDVLVLLNQDILVEDGWLAALREAFTETEAGVVGCKILSAVDRSLRHAGGYVHEILGVPFHYNDNSADSFNVDSPQEVQYVTGAAIGIRRHLIEQVGFLDERFFPAYYEDVDFCFRARAAGYKVLYWPKAVVLHYESTTVPEHSRWFYFQRGRIRFVLKHWPLNRLTKQFAEAEIGFQVHFAREFGSTWPLRLAYAIARLEIPFIIAERGLDSDPDCVQHISDMLRRLHMQALIVDFGRATGFYEPMAYPMMPGSFTKSFFPKSESHIKVPDLEEFEFHSTVPIIGGVIETFRRAWYTVTAKWAIRHLVAQQQAINQYFCRYLECLEQRITVTNLFVLNSIVEAETEAIFSVLWPLRWDLVLGSTFPGGSSYA